MKELIRVVDIPGEFRKSALAEMFPGYSVCGDDYGYFYAVEQTKTVLVSYGWMSLIEVVKKHMAGNGIQEPLTLELLMADFFCRYKPKWCAEIIAEKEAKISAWKMMKRFYNTAVKAWNSGESVSQEEANRRAEICSRCPKNTDAMVEFCIGCHTRDLLMRAREAIDSRSTPYDGKLKNCACCACNLRLKVWMPKSSMTDPEIKWETGCWMDES